MSYVILSPVTMIHGSWWITVFCLLAYLLSCLFAITSAFIYELNGICCVHKLSHFTTAKLIRITTHRQSANSLLMCEYWIWICDKCILNTERETYILREKGSNMTTPTPKRLLNATITQRVTQIIAPLY